jgi:uncharacterized membrane protein YdjX (TVP38/TMEM64 family)
MNAPETHSAENTHRAWLRPLLLALALAALLCLVRVYNPSRQLEALNDWLAGLGPWGPLAFIGLYALATVVMVPGTMLALLAGALFGTARGVAFVSIASTLGAALCFVIARHVARASILRWLGGSPKFRRLDEMSREQGGWLVAIVRLVPLFPFNLVNYGLGLTAVGFWQYVRVSWLCMLPGTIVCVAGADAFFRVLRGGAISWPLAGLVAGLGMLLFVAARRIKRGMSGKKHGAAGQGGTRA